MLSPSGRYFPWLRNHQHGCYHQLLFGKDNQQLHFLLLSCILFQFRILRIAGSTVKSWGFASFALDILARRGLCGQRLLNRLSMAKISQMRTRRPAIPFILSHNSFVHHLVFGWYNRQPVIFFFILAENRTYGENCLHRTLFRKGDSSLELVLRERLLRLF